MMPEMSGYDFIRAYRKERETPIILLTAKLDETDKVLGLELGADDYVTKPFGMKELSARIHAVLRRATCCPSPDQFWLSPMSASIRIIRTVTVSGRAVSLTPSEFDLLSLLMSAPGAGVFPLRLARSLQGTTFESVERTIDVHIRNLRTKIEPTRPSRSTSKRFLGWLSVSRRIVTSRGRPADEKITFSSGRKSLLTIALALTVIDL